MEIKSTGGELIWSNILKILEALNAPQPKREFIIYRPLTEEEKAIMKQNKKYFKK